MMASCRFGDNTFPELSHSQSKYTGKQANHTVFRSIPDLPERVGHIVQRANTVRNLQRSHESTHTHTYEHACTREILQVHPIIRSIVNRSINYTHHQTGTYTHENTKAHTQAHTHTRQSDKTAQARIHLNGCLVP
jgi:hypothetical protein